MWLLRKYPYFKSQRNFLSVYKLPLSPPKISPSLNKPHQKGLCHNISPGLNYGILRYVNRETNTFTAVHTSAHEPTKTVIPFSDKQNLKISGVDSSMEKLFTGGLSETAPQQSMWWPASLPNYRSSWAPWVDWCNKGKAEPFQCDINQVVNHLRFLFGAGLELKTIGCHMSGQLFLPIMIILMGNFLVSMQKYVHSMQKYVHY